MLAGVLVIGVGLAVGVINVSEASQTPKASALQSKASVVRPKASAAVPPPDDTGFLLGANRRNCKPSAAHPNPVILVHGTFENMSNNWFVAAPKLAREGFCVFAFNYGGKKGNPIQGTGPAATSAQQLSLFVDKVLGQTGAKKVDIVGHSQGGMMPRQYLKFLGGAAKVQRLVGLAPPNHGTNLIGLADLATNFGVIGSTVQELCAACTDQIEDSKFLTTLNAGGDTVPGVTYTVIATKFDEIVTPFTSGFLDGPDVENITLQDVCPNDFSEHIAISFDNAALTLAINALDPANPRKVPCR